MTGTQTIRMLARYNAWANKTMFNAVFALPSGEAAKQRPTLFRTWSTPSTMFTSST